MVLGTTFVLCFVPAAAAVGILFALLQWYLVSCVSVGGHGGEKEHNNGYMHVSEDGIDDIGVVAKCAEIQNAISEGTGNGSGVWGWSGAV